MSQAVAAKPQSSSHRLAGMFEPKSIALVGATEKGFWGFLVTRNFRELGYEGRVYAVNRSGNDVFGYPGYKSCAEIPEKIDVAFLLLPQSSVLDSLGEIAAAGICNAVVLSAGYAETGDEGSAMQEELIARARSLGIILWGPNSLGFNNIGAKTPISAIPNTMPLLPPSIAILTQSGASAVELNELAHNSNIGSSFLAATGNEAMVRIADIVDYLVDHADTKAIAIFAETIRDPAAFALAAERARAAGKPIVIFKIGRSELAGSVARAHTGSIVGDDKVFDAVCERLGIVRVRSAEELITTAALLAATGPLKAPGFLFISTSGGACTIVADGAEAAGVPLPAFSEETKAKLRAVLPGYASTFNPLDITGALMTEPDLFEKVIPIAAASPEIGLVAVNIIVPTQEGQGFVAGHPPLARALAALDKPTVIASTISKTLNQHARDELGRHDLPHVVNGLDQMLGAIGRLGWWSGQAGERPALPSVAGPDRGAGTVVTGERELLDRLAAAGVPVIPGEIATSRADAERIAAAADGPLVLKIASKDIEHKTELGGVRLNVAPGEAGAAFDDIMAKVVTARPDAKIDGVIVSPMRGKGVELLVGITRDPVWGPILTVGLGGVLVEVMADVVSAPLPVAAGEVKAMLGRLRGAKLLQGYRGSQAADLDKLAGIVAKIGEAALAMGTNLESLEVNPLLVAGDRIEALDALALWDE